MPIFSSTGGTMPSLSSSSAASRWIGRSSGLPCSEASWFARWTASCALTVNLSQRMGMDVSLLSFCHSERSEEPMQYAGGEKLHGSFALLRMTRIISSTKSWEAATYAASHRHQGLKPASILASFRGAEALLFHEATHESLPGVARPDSRGRLSPHEQLRLRGFAWALGFDRLLAADVDLDLFRLGFGLFGERDLQHAFVVGGRDGLGVHGLGQSEAAGEAA